ncbi:MAG TPA: glycoside hydrolase family 43 protein [Methylomirabilota bacterium]|nr:glycoside hydrolase family 43 protein [Methylomirabilota bacterium]
MALANCPLVQNANALNGSESVTVAAPETLPMSVTPRAEVSAGMPLDRIEATPRTFANPILPAPSADPWVIYHNGFYYLAESRNQQSLWIRKARLFTELAGDPGVMIWSAPESGANCNAIWAPELHFINGRWYIYYAADDGLNENHRMWVLESDSEDPLSSYRCRGVMDTQGWAIDGTVLTMDNGQNYFVWSGWPGTTNGRQNLYIAPMANPWTLGAPRTLLTEPDALWERIEMDICEGPQVLQAHGKTFIIYSASGSWCTDYCLGMLVFKGGDVLNPAAWEKVGPVFKKTTRVWGVGHCSFTKSPDGTEDWIVYHAKSREERGWNDRHVLAQPFTWGEDGLPHFGKPVGAGVRLPIPAGAEMVAA